MRAEEINRNWGVVVPACALLLAFAGTSPASDQVVEAQQPTPTFRASIDLVTIDVQVTPTKDEPIRDLTAADFDIRISGRKRPAASATLLHHDEGAITREPPRTTSGNPPACVFGFHRKIDKTTAHYLISVERTDADRREVKQVDVKLVETAFAVQWSVWRSPIRRLPS